MNNNQSGFAILEALLILVIVAVISGVGWYAVHTKHQTDKILAQSEKTSQSVPLSAQKTSAPQDYINIREWGVKLKTSDITRDAIYKVVNEHTAYLTTGAYENVAPGCALNGKTGSLIRGKAGYEVVGPGSYTIENSGTSYVNDAGQTVQQNPVKVGEYYFMWSGPQAPCFNPNTANLSQMDRYQKALSDLAYTVQASP